MTFYVYVGKFANPAYTNIQIRNYNMMETAYNKTGLRPPIMQPR